MTAPLDELEALRWLKDSAVNEPELPSSLQAQLWKRVSHDISALALGSAGAATALGKSAAGSTCAANAVSESAAGSICAANGVGESAGSAGAVAPSGVLATGGLGIAAREIAARLALWSAPSLVLGALAGVAGQRALLPQPTTSVHVEPAGTQPASAPAALGVESLPLESELEAPDAPKSAVRSEKGAPTTGTEPRSSNGLARERAVLDRARIALAAGELERALQETKRHAREFPSGILAEEREVMAINVLVRLGKFPQANKRAESFRARYPQSLMTHSVDAAMAAVPKE